MCAHARARRGVFNATWEGAISDTVAREGGSSTHRTQCPQFSRTGDCTAVSRLSTPCHQSQHCNAPPRLFPRGAPHEKYHHTGRVPVIRSPGRVAAAPIAPSARTFTTGDCTAVCRRRRRVITHQGQHFTLRPAFCLPRALHRARSRMHSRPHTPMLSGDTRRVVPLPLLCVRRVSLRGRSPSLVGDCPRPLYKRHLRALGLCAR